MKNWSTRLLTATLVGALCGGPQLAGALTQEQSGQQQQETTAPKNAAPDASGQSTPDQQTTANQDANSATPSPSRQNLPDAPSTQSTNSGNDSSQQGKEPAGTAAAQAGKTRGGMASKPAGAAIAPAKQKRTRSLLIKLGLIAGAGVAVGSVYALSKGSPSRPPGAR